MSAILCTFSFFVLASSATADAVKNETTVPLQPTSLLQNVTIKENEKAEFPRLKTEGTTIIRAQRECSIMDLNGLKVRITTALERQVEKMIQEDYVGTIPESPSCTRFHGLSMNYPIRLFIRTTVENAIFDYKLELLKP